MSRMIRKHGKSGQMEMGLSVCMYVQYVLCVWSQVSDVGKILGIVHTENIQVTAEAYDIALDISPGGI